MKATCGLTLMETLVVVVIIGVVAAIAIPQYSCAAANSRTSGLAYKLQTMREQIELYKRQHDQMLPLAAGEGEADFVRRMTTRTDIEGGTGGVFGPYMLRVPTNPFNHLDTVRIGGEAAGANTHGWRLDPTTGRLQPDDDYDADSDGKPDHINL
jgi:general secretion pathway protein G